MDRSFLVSQYVLQYFRRFQWSLQDISSHAAYTIVNSEPLVDFAPPTLNRIVYVGGLGAREPKKVDEVSIFKRNLSIPIF